MTDALRRARLIDWYAAGHRDLPWRRTRDPWAIWVSEIMLQQTRAASVVPYFTRFMARFPTPAALASAPLDDLLALWAGLGYYTRARNLHLAAQQVVERHGGAVPDDPSAFAALAGVGPYTAGAVQSIAFGHPEPVLDGNVIRVLSRWDRLDAEPRGPAAQRVLWARARALADGPLPGTLNQALMELGATVCTPRAPACLLCPVLAGCAAAAAGDAEAFPRKSAPKTRPGETFTAALVIANDDAASPCVWLARRPDTGLLAGLWELPMVPGVEPVALEALGLRAEGEGRRISHAFTHRTWTLNVHRAVGEPAGGDYTAFRQVRLDALDDAGLSGPALKALHAWQVAGAPRRRGAGRHAAGGRGPSGTP